MDADLLALQRAVEAEGTARAYSKLARALERAGRPLEAYTAAARAVQLDPADAARDLLVLPLDAWPRTQGKGPWGGEPCRSVPWAGLRKLRGKSVTHGAPVTPRLWPPTPRVDSIVDLGRLICIELYDGLVGYDLITGRAYRPCGKPSLGYYPTRVLGAFGERVVLVANSPKDTDARELWLLNPATGARDSISIPGGKSWTDIGHSDSFDLIVVAADLIFIFGYVDPGDGSAYDCLYMGAIDPARGSVLAPVSVPSGVVESVRYVGGQIVFFTGPGLHAMDPRTREIRWKRGFDAFVRPSTIVNPWLVWQDEPLRLLELDPKNGEVLNTRSFASEHASEPVLTESAVIFVMDDVLTAIDPKTLATIWEKPLEPGWHQLLATRDTAIVLERREPSGIRVATVDPATGEERSSCRPSGASLDPTPILASGALVMASASPGGSVVVVGEDLERP